MSRYYSWFPPDTHRVIRHLIFRLIFIFRKVYASWPLICHSVTFEMDVKMRNMHAGDTWTAMIRILKPQKCTAHPRESFRIVSTYDCIFPLKETSLSTFPSIYHVLAMLISALLKLCSLNRYFFLHHWVSGFKTQHQNSCWPIQDQEKINFRFYF